ncbi:MAG: tripartite tricarboxylate transporter TctB family protein [Gammaproteobacteria bacterium]|nr:tripartite tricarboxylate transporter TctB family protein [Gammaproteobacteria bacterium]
MQINIKKTIGGLFFLVLSIVYGWNALNIALFSSVVETFSARTLPTALSVAGIIFSILLLISPERDDSNNNASFIEMLRSLNWKTAIYLFIAMTIYGLIFGSVGFFIATFLFLNCSFWIMGERNLIKMVGITTILVVTFWFFLNYLLGIYIDPGFLFNTWLTPT